SRTPPVQESTPQTEGPAKRITQPKNVGERPPDHEQREGIEQAECCELAERMHRQRPKTMVSEHDAEDSQEDVATDHDRDKPPREDAAQRQAHNGRENEQAVGGRVKKLTETGHLLQPTRENPVEIVGDTRN